MPARTPFTSPTSRLVVAFAAFLGAVVGGIGWLAKRGGNPLQQPIARSAAPAPEGEAAAPVFYESIGHAPAGFGQAESGGKLSFTLEVDLTDKREEAERLIDTLKERGVDAYYTPLSRAGKVVYRVRHGIYPSREEAQKAQLALKDQRKVATKVVKLQ
jgi:septal ring-binding cell division protein DamX